LSTAPIVLPRSRTGWRDRARRVFPAGPPACLTLATEPITSGRGSGRLSHQLLLTPPPHGGHVHGSPRATVPCRPYANRARTPSPAISAVVSVRPVSRAIRLNAAASSTCAASVTYPCAFGTSARTAIDDTRTNTR